MNIDCDSWRATYKELIADVEFAKKLDKDSCSEGFIKRTYTRAFFAFVDGFVFQLKRIALQANREVFNHIELGLLEETEGFICDDGGVRSSKKKLSLLNNLQFSTKAVVKACAIQYKLRKDGKGWKAMRDAVKIRDRITHPKSLDDLRISDQELKHTLGEANAWFRDEMVRLINKL